MKILPCLQCLSGKISETNLRRLNRIVLGMMCVTGRITQLSISRWIHLGGAYRTVQRFFHSKIDWQTLYLTVFMTHHFDPNAYYILAGDETVVSKSGKTTHGLGRFYSSIASRVIKGLSIFTLSIVNTGERYACPLSFEQLVRAKPNKTDVIESETTEPPKEKKGAGRPIGSKNKVKSEEPLSEELQRIFNQTDKLIKSLKGRVKLEYFTLDGHFGNHLASLMVRRLNMHIISKLQRNSALCFPQTAEQKRDHPKRKYGDKVDFGKLPISSRISCTVEKGVREEVYDLICLHEDFADPIRVAVLIATKIATGEWANVNLFSTDVNLEGSKIKDYYSLRYQIEFNFRDAKQHFGLEDFMSVKEASVANSIGIAFFQVSLSRLLLKPLNEDYPDAGICDLKGRYRSQRYVEEFMKFIRENPGEISSESLLARISGLGRIHPAKEEHERIPIAA